MSGERGDVDDSVCEDWKKKLPDICEGYEPKDIFNMDETGVFFGRARERRLWLRVQTVPAENVLKKGLLWP